MGPVRAATALCALCALALANEPSMNFFYSFDGEYYLGLSICSMLSAFSMRLWRRVVIFAPSTCRRRPPATRRGRELKFFVLYRAPLTADLVCNATSPASSLAFSRRGARAGDEGRL